MDRFGTGFFGAGGECFWFLYAAHGDFAAGNSKAGGARSDAGADRARWGRGTRKLAGNAPPFEAALPLLRLNRAVARFTKGLPLRGIGFLSGLKPRPTKIGTWKVRPRVAYRSSPSLADSQGKLKLRPTKNGTRIAWRG